MRYILALAMIVCLNVMANAQTLPAEKPRDSSSVRSTIRHRCPGTQLATPPLIILDDCIYEGDLNAIDPNTIESITVLKNKTAFALYGSKATNGVIIINTKKKEKKKKPESVPIT
jgi:TonB-dependent SusC/RagA subfamily outer membrane receptor